MDGKVKKGEDPYKKEFEELRNISEALKSQPEYSCLEAQKICNQRKNRYKDILPFDCSRVKLKGSHGGVAVSDYINANHIQGAYKLFPYIATQAPMFHTVEDFWRMIVEYNVYSIVMACNIYEYGKAKCVVYWPEQIGSSLAVTDITISLVQEHKVGPDFVIRNFCVRFKNQTLEERTVRQYHYFSWPDHGTPLTIHPLLHLISAVHSVYPHNYTASAPTTTTPTHSHSGSVTSHWRSDVTPQSDSVTSLSRPHAVSPILVHCSAGCGRTGSICAIDIVWNLLRTCNIRHSFCLFDIIAELRRQRTAMVQTRDQYALVFHAIREMFVHHLRTRKSPMYSNISDYSCLYPPRLSSSAEPLDQRRYSNIPPTTYGSASSPPITCAAANSVAPQIVANDSHSVPLPPGGIQPAPLSEPSAARCSIRRSRSSMHVPADIRAPPVRAPRHLPAPHVPARLRRSCSLNCAPGTQQPPPLTLPSSGASDLYANCAGETLANIARIEATLASNRRANIYDMTGCSDHYSDLWCLRPRERSDSFRLAVQPFEQTTARAPSADTPASEFLVSENSAFQPYYSKDKQIYAIIRRNGVKKSFLSLSTPNILSETEFEDTTDVPLVPAKTPDAYMSPVPAKTPDAYMSPVPASAVNSRANQPDFVSRFCNKVHRWRHRPIFSSDIRPLNTWRAYI